MPTTYAQKQAPAQKMEAKTAASVVDCSSQGEALQRKANLTNGAVQRVKKGEELLTQWERFFRKIENGCTSFIMDLNGSYYKFIVGDKTTSFNKASMNSDIKEINLSRDHVSLIKDNPIALKQIVLHEIGHSRYTQKNDDELYVAENNRGYINGVVNSIINEFHSDMYAFSTLLADEMQHGAINIHQIISKIDLGGRPRNWIEAYCGYPPASESVGMFLKWFNENGVGNQFEEKYNSLRDEMVEICNQHKIEMEIGHLVCSMKKCGDAKLANRLNQEEGGKIGADVNLNTKSVHFGNANIDVSFLVK